MISVDEALKQILDNTKELSAEKVPLADAVDRILAQDVYAREDIPSFDNSAMDGFAVKVKDVVSASKTSPVRLQLREVVRAGQVALAELKEGEAIKVMTGAPLPQGAQAVVMKEFVEGNQTNGHVLVCRRVASGENIRPQGEDVRAGELILKKGTPMRAYEIALLAAQGIIQVQVTRKPKIVVVATGDEIVDATTQTLPPGKIRNSNSPAIQALLKRWGTLSWEMGVIGDEPGELTKAFEGALSQADLLIVSGGVSVGDFDYTKGVLEKLGMKTVFWRVAIKPGKPLLFGLIQNTLIFGVPGNPVSTLVCLEEFVRPCLEKMRGYATRHPSWHISGTVDEDQIIHDSERQHYLFSQVQSQNEQFLIHVIRPQGSAMVGMATKANALVKVPVGTRSIKKGERLAFRWLK